MIDRRGSPRSGDDGEELHVVCQCANGSKRSCDIPVYAKGKPKKLTNEWQYERVGDILHITPSLHWLNVFHNGFNWSVKFVEFDPEQYPSPRVQLRKINGLEEKA